MKTPPRQKPRPPQLLGALLLLLVIILVVALKVFGSNPSPSIPSPTSTLPTSSAIAIATSTAVAPVPTTANLTLVTGYGGGIKESFFKDPDIQRILADRYGLAVNLNVYGSIASMCEAQTNNADFLWVGDQSSVSIYTKQCGGTLRGKLDIYNSPLVFYSWPDITDALMVAGVVTKTGEIYTIDTAAIIGLVDSGRTWTSIGLPSYNGKVKIRTTDPALSNSGFLFAGLFGCVLNGGDEPTMQTVAPLLPPIQALFQGQGYMPDTSAAFFNQFLSQGRGAYPIAVGYESQILEYLIQYPAKRPQVVANVRMLYPEPTVWASHPFIARTSNGERLMNALKDPEIQALALSHHGNRPNFPASQTGSTPVPYPGYLDTISSTCHMPASEVMQSILAAVTTQAPLPTASAAPATGGTPDARDNPG